MRKRKKVVVGFGSLSGDDQAGWSAIDKLEQLKSIQNKDCDDVVFFQSKADGADWFPVVEDASEIIFIDAVYSGDDVGVIHVITDRAGLAKKFSLSSHAIGIFDSIELAEALGYLKVAYTFFGIEIGRDDENVYRNSEDINNNGITEAVKKAIQTLTTQVERKLLES